MKPTTGVQRLDAMIELAIASRIGGGQYLLDCYMGKQIRTEYSHAITTRTATDDNTFVLEVYEDNNRSDTEGQVIQEDA